MSEPEPIRPTDPAPEMPEAAPPEGLEDIDPVDRRLAAMAMDKLRKGEKLEREEIRALTRVRRATEDAQQWKHYRHCPMKHMLIITGRQKKQLDAQAERYGIPFGGVDGVVDLTAVVRGMIEWFSKNHDAIAVALRDTADGSVRAQLKAVELEKKKMELAERQGKLVDLELAVGMTVEILARLRKALEDLGKDVGADKVQQVHEALEEVKAEFMKKLGGGA